MMNDDLVAKLEKKANIKIDAVLRWREFPASPLVDFFTGVHVGMVVAVLDDLWDGITADPNCPANAAWERVNARAKQHGIHL